MPLRVLIVGAGVAGPALAWHLSRVGVQVKVIEKSKDFLDQGQNIDVRHTALTVVKRMGLFEQLQAHNTNEKGTKFIDDYGRTYASFPCREGYVSPTSAFEILRGDLAKVLYSATRGIPSITYQFDTTLQDVISNDDDSVRVRLSDGKEEEYDVVVGADGQWSRLRKSVFQPDEVDVVDKELYMAYFTIPRLDSDDDWWNVYHALGSRIISLRPDSYGTTRAMLAYMPTGVEELQTWKEGSRAGKETQMKLLEAKFADAGWQADRLVGDMKKSTDFYFQSVSQIKMKNWSKGRIILLGDAAFCPSPLSGSGAHVAIIGSYVLAGELGKLKTGQHPEVAFKAYEEAFRPYVHKIQDIPSQVPANLCPGSAFKRWLFRTSIKLADTVVHLPWIAGKFAGEHGDEVENWDLPEYECFAQVNKT